MSAALHIRNGRIVDPASGRDEISDICVANGLIVEKPAPGSRVIDATDLVVVPGLIDLHVHLREPGGEDAENIESGSRAAARGGFTTIVAMPNTRPPYDTPERVAFVTKRGFETGLVRVLPSGCITAEQKGQRLAGLAPLKAAGAVAFTDDGSTVQDDSLMLMAMEQARGLGVVIMDHAQDSLIERQGGVMHEGEFSRKHGLPGIPSFAEEKIVRRDVEAAERTGGTVHIQHVTSREGVALIRDGRACGVHVTGELTPHHLVLTDADVDPTDANFKMNPPLRSAEDRAALVAGLLDGTLGCFATDHAPHSAEKKARGFLKGPFGIVGLETAVGITYTATVQAGLMDLATWVRRWTGGPASVLGLPAPALVPGAPADLAVLDLSTAWAIDPTAFVSRSRNTPFAGRKVTGRAVVTLCAGRITWEAPA